MPTPIPRRDLIGPRLIVYPPRRGGPASLMLSDPRAAVGAEGNPRRAVNVSVGVTRHARCEGGRDRIPGIWVPCPHYWDLHGCDAGCLVFVEQMRDIRDISAVFASRLLLRPSVTIVPLGAISYWLDEVDDGMLRTIMKADADSEK